MYSNVTACAVHMLYQLNYKCVLSLLISISSTNILSKQNQFDNIFSRYERGLIYNNLLLVNSHTPNPICKKHAVEKIVYYISCYSDC